MVREKYIKDKSYSINKMGDNNINMDIEDFFKSIEIKNKLSIYRHINVILNTKGNKIPFGEKNNLTVQDIQSNRGNINHNTLSLSVKHIPDLYVIDFDSKDVHDDPLYEKLKNDCVAFTETKKGSHYYVNIKNITPFSNQQKINIDPLIDMDLIKTNNIWETKGRIVNGTIKEYDWNDINRFFDVKKMNFKNSPPSSPPASPKKLQLIQEEEFIIPINQVKIPICTEEEFKKHINSFKPRFEYNDWLSVGFICYNNFQGSDLGLKFWNIYSKQDEEGYEGKKKLQKKYSTFNSDDSNKLSYKQFIKWNLIDYPCKNKYEHWYITDYDSFISNMNMECMFHTKTQDIIIIANDYYFRAKKGNALDYYSKFSFTVKGKKEEDIKVNPFDIWINNIDRRDISDIVFDPSGKEYESKYNIWKGYKYQKTGEYEKENIKPFVQHIKNIICNGDEALAEYVIKWFAQIIQTPQKKTKVGLVWRSEAEGVGKNLILNLIRDIIGSEYYYSTSNLEHLIGNFNADAEAKILINMNECLWGGDKKKEGRLKEFITELTLTINQKGVKTYNIDNYANVVITSNSDWIIGVNQNDRRWQMIECAEIKHDSGYYKKLADTNLQDLTNYLYSIDLTDYDPTEIIKTKLHHEQVELNMDTAELFWVHILEKKKIYGRWLNKPYKIKKSELHEIYMKCEIFGQHDYKMNNVSFWKKIRKISPSLQFISTGNLVVIQTADILREEYNKYYKYDKFNLSEKLEYIDFEPEW
tara:strand:+ start:12346 stop:14607 length:2262 start_codon:yes stop_codon:yes gene_type:complete